MLKDDALSDQIYEGNDRFEGKIFRILNQFYNSHNYHSGYCKDLADILMNSMNLTYTLVLVNDSKYGAEDSKAPLGWNGE